MALDDVDKVNGCMEVRWAAINGAFWVRTILEAATWRHNSADRGAVRELPQWTTVAEPTEVIVKKKRTKLRRWIRRRSSEISGGTGL